MRQVRNPCFKIIFSEIRALIQNGTQSDLRNFSGRNPSFVAVEARISSIEFFKVRNPCFVIFLVQNPTFVKFITLSDPWGAPSSDFVPRLLFLIFQVRNPTLKFWVRNPTLRPLYFLSFHAFFRLHFEVLFAAAVLVWRLVLRAL